MNSFEPAARLLWDPGHWSSTDPDLVSALSTLAISSLFPEDLVAVSKNSIFLTTAPPVASDSPSHGTAFICFDARFPVSLTLFILCAAGTVNAAPGDVAAASVPGDPPVDGGWFFDSFALNDRALIYRVACCLVDRSVAQPRELDVTRLSPSYPPVGGSTASLGMFLLVPVLLLRDVVARLGSILSPLCGLP